MEPRPTIHSTLAARISGPVAASGPEGTAQQTRGGAESAVPAAQAPGAGWMTSVMQIEDDALPLLLACTEPSDAL